MSKLTLAVLVSGLALSLASPVVVHAQPKDADQGAAPAQSKKGITPKADTRSEKAKASGSVPSKDTDQPTKEAMSKKGVTPKADTRTDAQKAKGSVASPDTDQPTKEAMSKKK